MHAAKDPFTRIRARVQFHRRMTSVRFAAFSGQRAPAAALSGLIVVRHGAYLFRLVHPGRIILCFSHDRPAARADLIRPAAYRSAAGANILVRPEEMRLSIPMAVFHPVLPSSVRPSLKLYLPHTGKRSCR